MPFPLADCVAPWAGLLLLGLAGAAEPEQASEVARRPASEGVIESADAPETAAAAPDESSSPLFRGLPAVGLEDLRAEPPRWLRQRVRFVIQFDARQVDWNPYLTRFGPGDWTAFSAWADERFTWNRDVYDDPVRRLFVRRGGALDAVLDEIQRHERFEVVGRVREVFLDEPWIEVESLRPLREWVGEGSILHVARARELAAQGSFELAFDQLDRAAAAPLPAHAAAELGRMRAFLERLRDQEIPSAK